MLVVGLDVVVLAVAKEQELVGREGVWVLALVVVRLDSVMATRVCF